MAPGEFDPPFDRSKALAFDSEHLLRSENIAFDIDNWYPALRHWTFESEFVPLSRPEARAVARYYRARFLGRGRELFRPADAKVLQNLEDSLDRAVRGRFGAAGCFVRLCGRSPKDGEPLDRARVRREYEAALEALAPPGGEADARRRLPAALRMRAAAGVATLRARSGSEVMSLLLASERVYSDMLDWLWYGEPEQIVLRRWEPEISVDLEFRLYVHEESLTAISQYDHHCRYDHLFALRDQLLPRMVALWQEVHPHVGAASYCIDIAYLPRRDELRVLELSPFLRCSGAHCFRWGRPEDVDVLEGRRPFEFRLVQQPSEDFDEMFCSGWEQRWYCEDPPAYWEFYQSRWQRCAVGLRRRLRHLPPQGSGCLKWWLLPAGALALSPRARAGRAPLLAGLLLAGAASLSVALALIRKARQRHWAPLFAYGTLKRGMQWNTKFLSHGAVYVGPATTVAPFPLVTGRCGVPYMLFDKEGLGQRVCGEVWRVDADTLEGLDQYEGLSKGYYSRPQVQVELGGRLVHAHVYAMQDSPASFRRLLFQGDYGLQWHSQRYRAVEHILLKQRLYLQGCSQYSRRRAPHPACSLEEDAAREPRTYRPRPFLAAGPCSTQPSPGGTQPH